MQPTQSDHGARLIRAAQYIRMSTEHQQYSTENQADAIREYAETRGYEIVRTYADHGKSGLRVVGREAPSALVDLRDPSPQQDGLKPLERVGAVLDPRTAFWSQKDEVPSRGQSPAHLVVDHA